MKMNFNVAVLDLYEGHPNQGKRSIEAIVQEFSIELNLKLTYDVFDTRGNAEVPTLDYDAYIATGGPGSPLSSEGSLWEKQMFSFIEKLMNHNASDSDNKKPLFLICHSFQVFSRYYNLATVSLRKSTSFGIFPVHKTEFGLQEPFFKGLHDPFFAADHRDYQITQVNQARLDRFGAKVLCLEKIRPHVPLERAVMAMRINDYIIGTQFHPEADPAGMLHYFSMPEKKEQIIEKYGEAKLGHMMEQLSDNGPLLHTRRTVLPAFLQSALTFKQILHDQGTAKPL